MDFQGFKNCYPLTTWTCPFGDWLKSSYLSNKPWRLFVLQTRARSFLFFLPFPDPHHFLSFHRSCFFPFPLAASLSFVQHPHASPSVGSGKFMEMVSTEQMKSSRPGSTSKTRKKNKLCGAFETAVIISSHYSLTYLAKCFLQVCIWESISLRKILTFAESNVKKSEPANMPSLWNSVWIRDWLLAQSSSDTPLH